MHYGVHLEDYSTLWEQAIHQEDGSCSPRTESDEVEQNFWASFMGQKSGYTPDEYSKPIASFVTGLLRESGIKSVLEIGPGWGNYTLPIAGACPNLTCLDLSPDVLDYIRRIASENGYHAVKTICSKWETCILQEPFDAVFGYNCFYRMRDLKASLKKINNSAQKLCVVGMTSGPEQPFLVDFQKEQGLDIRFDRLDYIYFTNTLYNMGIDVNCQIIPLEKEYSYNSAEEMLKSETGRIQNPEFNQVAILEILSRYFKFSNGKYRFRHAFNGAVLYWYK